MLNKLQELFRDPSSLWEAIGPDGVQYPDSDTFKGDRNQVYIARQQFDDDLARQIGTYLEAREYWALGYLIASNAIPYLLKQAKDHAELLVDD